MPGDKYYVVERRSVDSHEGQDTHIQTTIVAGPFDTPEEAHNVQAESYNIDTFGDPNGIWYDVWDEGALRARGFLP